MIKGTTLTQFVAGGCIVGMQCVHLIGFSVPCVMVSATPCSERLHYAALSELPELGGGDGGSRGGEPIKLTYTSTASQPSTAPVKII